MINRLNTKVLKQIMKVHKQHTLSKNTCQSTCEPM